MPVGGGLILQGLQPQQNCRSHHQAAARSVDRRARGTREPASDPVRSDSVGRQKETVHNDIGKREGRKLAPERSVGTDELRE